MLERIQSNKICFVIIYFGEWPSYIKLFLNSCSYQKEIDFLFVSDNELPCKVSANIIQERLEMSEFNVIASDKTGLKINITRGYKLCDLKPAWCHILEDRLSDYEYVGYCDIDLVFGDISYFLKPVLAGNFDFFTVTRTYCSGATTIFRNTSYMRMLYQKAKGWQYIFENENNFIFDELLSVRDSGYESYTDVIKKEEKENGLKVYWGKDITIELRPKKVIEYNLGHVFYLDREWISFHSVVAKHSVFWTFPDWEEIPSQYFIGKYGYYIKKNRPITIWNLFIYGWYRKQFFAALKKKKNTIKRIFCKFDVVSLCKAVYKQFKCK